MSEIYNVSEENIEIKDATVTFTDFEDNGYLGLVFKTHKIDDSDLTLKFNCSVKPENGKIQEFVKKVFLFRPSIELIKYPEKINIIFDNDDFHIEERISIKNRGPGTAIIKLKINEQSDFQKETPKEMGSFISAFNDDFIHGLKSLKKEYCIYAEFLTRLINLVSSEHGFSDQKLDELKYIKINAEIIFQDDQKFADLYLHNLVHAYMKNIYIITPYESFASYLKSIEAGNIIIQDSIDVLTIQKAQGTLEGELEITDLNMNIYTPIKLSAVEIKVNGNVDFPIQIPIYRIFQWG